MLRMEFEPFLPVQRWIDVLRIAHPLFLVNIAQWWCKKESPTIVLGAFD